MAGEDLGLVVSVKLEREDVKGGANELAIAVSQMGGRIEASMKSLENETRRSLGQVVAALGRETPAAAAAAAASVVKLEATAAPALANVSRQVREVGNDFVRTSERVTIGASGIQGQIRIFGAVAAALGTAYIAARGIETVTQNTVDWAAATEKLSNGLGVSSQQASIWMAAAREANVPIEKIEGTLAKLNARITSDQSVFKRLGIDITDATGKLLPLNQAFEQTIKGLYEFERGRNRDDAASQIFGVRFQPGQVEELGRFVESQERAAKVVEAFGLAVDQHGVVAAREFEAAQADLKLALLGVEETLAAQLMPALEQTLDRVLALARDGTLKAWAEGAAQGMRSALDVAGEVTGVLIEERGVLLQAGEAWLGYKAALISVSLIQSLTTAVTALTTAIRGSIAAEGLATMFQGLNASAMLARESVYALATGITEAAQTMAVFETFMEEATAAEALAGGLRNVALGAGLVTHEALAVETAIAGWEFTQQAAAAESVGVAFTHIGAAMTVAGTGAAAAAGQMGLVEAAMGATTIAIDGLLAAINPVLLIAGLVTAGAALATFEDQWKNLADDGIQRAIDKLKEWMGLTAKSDIVPDRTLTDNFTDELRTVTKEINTILSSVAGSGGGEANLEKSLKDRLAELRERQGELQAMIVEQASGQYYEPQGAAQTDYNVRKLREGDKQAPDSKTALAAKFTELMTLEKTQLAQAGKNWEERVQIAERYTAKVKELLGEGSEWDLKQQAKEAQVRAQAANAGVAAHAKAESEITALARENANERLRLLTLTQDEEKEEIKRAVRDKVITVQEGQDRMLALLKEEIAARREILQLEAASIAGSPAKAASFSEQLKAPPAPGETQEQQQARILVELPPASAEKFVEVQHKLDELDAYFNKTVIHIKTEFDPQKQDIIRDAREIKNTFDEVGNDLSGAFNSFFDAMLQGSGSAAASLDEMRRQLRGSIQDTEVAARTAGVHSNAWVDAKNREIEAQNRLNQTLAQQANVQSAAQHLFQQWEQETVKAISNVVIDYVKFMVLRVALEKTTQSQLLSADKLGIGERAALRAADWTLEKLHLTQSTAEEIATDTRKGATKAAVATATDQIVVASADSAATEKSTIETAQTEASLTRSAAEGAGKAVAANADTPYVGIALGIAAAAAIIGIIMGFMGSFEEGGDVPSAGKLGHMHPDEMVLSRDTAERVRAYAATPQGHADLSGGARVPRTKGGQKLPLRGGEMVLPKDLAEDVRGSFFSAAGGMTEVPSTGGLAVLHPSEMVLDKGTADAVRGGAKGGDGKGGEHQGKEDGGKDKKDEKGGGKDKAGIQKAGGGVTAPAFAAVGGGGSGAGGPKIQDVRLVAAPAMVSTHAKGGDITASISTPVQTTPANGVTPVQNQGVQIVQVVGRVPVTFSAINSTIGLITPNFLGFAPSLVTTFGFLSAFEKGGYVPSTGPALVHEGEFVLPKEAVSKLTSKTGSATAVPEMVAKLTGARLGELAMDDPLAGGQATGGRGTFTESLHGVGDVEEPIEHTRLTERTAFAAAIGDTMPPVLQQENHFHNIDHSGAREFIRDNGHLIAEQTWKHTTRMNHGIRGRR
jgi:DNA-binding protein Fis